MRLERVHDAAVSPDRNRARRSRDHHQVVAMPTGPNVRNFGQAVAQPTATGDLGNPASQRPPTGHGNRADQRDQNPGRDEQMDDSVQRALGEVEREGTARWAATARLERV
jgi:hypothetical protein